MARRLLDSRPMTTRVRRARSRGFTLVELAVVVVIVGVLAVIAVVGYQKIIRSGKVSEATNVIGAIRIAQEDAKAERGTYVDIGTTTLCPQGVAVGSPPTGKTKTQWGGTCNGGAAMWSSLAVHINEPVLFGYATTMGTDGPTDGNSAKFNSFGDFTKQPPGPWYQIYAACDLDADSTTNPTEFVTSNGTNQIFSRNEGY